MASADNRESHHDIDSSGAVLDDPLRSSAPEDLALSPPPEENTTLSLTTIPNQETDIVMYDPEATEPSGYPPPDGLALLPPTEHEPTDSHMATLNQETNLVRWTESRVPTHFNPPQSSLPMSRYISPREQNPAARLPTAMAHGAHAPMPQFADERATRSAALLTGHEKHGITTYATKSTEQVELNPDIREDRDVLRYTDKLPMAGSYLWNSDHQKRRREQEAMIRTYYREDERDAQMAAQMAKDGPRVQGR
jgi:hypothetical protein